MLSYEESFRLIQDEFEELELETELSKLEDSVNRCIAEDIFADTNLPPFDNSAVDGIAVKFNPDIKEWILTNEIAAGNYLDIEKSECVLIMTGAKLPSIFDTVIPLEDYNLEGNKVSLKKEVKYHKGMNIRYTASDVSLGELVVSTRTFLNPRIISAIASCGRETIKVFKKLKFAIVASGDELIPISEKPTVDKIRVSNNYGLSAAVESLNQTAINYGFIKDDYNSIYSVIEKLLNSDADVVMTTGGVSVGKYDLVKDILLKLGVEQILWKANIKPGKPIFFGKFKKNNKAKLIFGLPGNPVSCLVNFDIFLKPSILKLLGNRSSIKVEAILQNDIKKQDGKRHFIRGFLKSDHGNWIVTTTKSQSSGNLVQLSNSNCLIEIDEKTVNPSAGEKVTCIMM